MKNAAEQHAFYDPSDETITYNDGKEENVKLISVTNSKKGYLFCSYWDATLEGSKLGYCGYKTFWLADNASLVEDFNKYQHQIIRLDVKSDQKVFFLTLNFLADQVKGYNFWKESIVLDVYPSFVDKF